MVSCTIDCISMTDILISWKVQIQCTRLSLSSSDMSLVHRCEVIWFFVSPHLALVKLDPLLFDWGSFYLLQPPNFAVEQAFLLFSLICATDLFFCTPALAFTESVISFHTFAFSAFVMIFVSFDLIVVIFFPPQAHIRKPSQLWRNVHLSVFLSFEQTIYFTKNTMELWDTIHWLSYLPTG